jgi:type IV pilus assembly protein PilY1
MKNSQVISRLLTCGAALFSLLPIFVQADDTEIYTGIAERDAPNVIFIMDTSGSMGWANDGDRNPGPGESRLEQVQEAAIDTINNTDGINIALMKFNEYRSSYGGYVDMPMTPVAEARAEFAQKMSSYRATGGTPITESLEEALRYLRGDDVNYGKYVRNGYTTYYSDSDSRNAGTYKSPVSHQCQKNHVVLFSDGEASGDTGANSRIRNLLKSIPAENRVAGLSTACDSDGGCAEEIAFYGNQEDLSDLHDGLQNVTFHTVGGFVQGDAQTKLENIAKYGSWSAPGKPVNATVKEGKGIYANVQNYDQLKKSLRDIFDAIAKTSSTFTAPAVSVNAFNNLEHLDQLYYSVFKPTDSAGWSGNLKRYRLNSEGVIEDINEDPAVDSATGFFSENAHSFWTLGSVPDGNEVRAGGAASRLTSTRKVATFLGSNKQLLAPTNAINEVNPGLTTDLLATPNTYTNDQVEKLLMWAKGIDVNDQDNDSLKNDARSYMEDPLHSQPVVINYGKDAINKTFDSTIFIATNSGFLHAFSSDENNPEEHFAFIPKELLPNLYQYFTGLSSLDKVYGLDGPLSYWHKDINLNGVILNSSNSLEIGEHIYLYQGMRRGGRSYYALDVTDRENPKYLWQIDNTTTGFDKLGQTWSKMSLATVNWLGNKTDVLFFGGGYDPDEDNKGSRSPSTMGNAIYMVNAATGALLWSGSNSGADLNMTQMKNSIVADIVAIDSTQDGLTNLLYTADVGGRIWRVDLNNKATSADTFAKGGVLADLNGGNESKNIRFFNTPDIAFTRYGDFSPEGQFQISIGSGYRAHPLDTRVVDRFYIINDTNVSSIPTTYKNYEESELADITKFSSATKEQQKAGSYYKLTASGEKVLARSVTVANNILFTTYRPVSASAAANCDADTGLTRLYQIAPTYNDSARAIDITDLAQGGIPPNPVVLFPPREDPNTGDQTSGGDGTGGSGGDGSSSGGSSGSGGSGDEDDENGDCEKLKAMTAIGAEMVKNSFSRCNQLSKTYWRINK